MTQAEFKNSWDVLLTNYGKKFDKKLFLINYESFKDTQNFNRYLVPIMKKNKYFPNVAEIQKVIDTTELLPEWYHKEYKREEYEFSDEDKKRFGLT